jgi:hypothetical protein
MKKGKREKNIKYIYIYPKLVLEFAQNDLRINLPQNLNLKLELKFGFGKKERKMENKKKNNKEEERVRLGPKPSSAQSPYCLRVAQLVRAPAGRDIAPTSWAHGPATLRAWATSYVCAGRHSHWVVGPTLQERLLAEFFSPMTGARHRNPIISGE